MKIVNMEALRLVLEKEVGIPISNLARVANPGMVNDVFILTTPGSQLVLRINDTRELSRFQKEKWCIEEAANAGVNVPEVIAVGGVPNYAYLLESYIEGQRGDKLTDTSPIWPQIGEHAKTIHNLRINGFGENLESMANGSLDDWDRYLIDNLQALETKNEAFIKASQLTNLEIDAISKWLNDLRHKKFQFGLSHGDISLKNVIVSENGKVSIIDWGNAAAHIVPHYDFGVILKDSLSDDSEDFRQFLDGYQMPYDEYLKIKRDILTIMLPIAVDKLRWSIDKRPELVEHKSEHLIYFYEARYKL